MSFVASIAAEQIVATTAVARDRFGRLLVEHDGRWVGGENDLHLAVARHLGREWSRRRGYEVVDHIKALAPVIEEAAQ